MADETDALIAVVRDMYAAFNRRDVEAALAFVAPDAELRPGGTAAVTGRTVYRGHDEIREYFADVARVWPPGLRVSPATYRAVAGSVVAYGRVEMEMPDGPIEDDVIWVWKLRDGLVTSGQIFPTHTAALAAVREGGTAGV